MPPEPCLIDALRAAAPMLMAENILRYALIAGATHLLAGLALVRGRARRIRPGARPGWPQIRAEILASLTTIAVFILVGALVVLGDAAGLLRVYDRIADYGWTWLVLSCLILIVAHDAWFYWTHRAMHHPRLFRLFHRAHHRSHNPTAFAAYRFDLSEAVVHAAFLPVALAVLPCHPAAILAFTTHMMLRNAVGHAGIEVFPLRADGTPRWPWLTTVTHHDLHHAEPRWNLGLYFTWWDRLGGTEHPAYAARLAAAVRPQAGAAAVLALAVLLAGGAVPSPALAEAPLRGDWATEGLGLVVRFEACAEDPALTCGRVVHAWDRRLARAGQIVEALRPAPGGGWQGSLIDPRNGLRFRGTARLADPDTLELSGCAGPLCRRQTWRSTRWLRTVTGGFRPLP
jgi:sterol desaturase/sphingolipid hydroxylase (fatty acid hydroxylase superfamily)